ncbi:hypothetical protein NQ998_15555, partial [Acinetobacter baumannii]|nr:hypothetical protein [Acinetobacter baumannii]
MAQQIVIEVPGTKISELEKTTSVSRGDVTPVVQGEETKQADIGQIADFVKSELGSAATKDASEFATPTDVSSVAIASQQRDDAQNERLDNVEYGLIAIGNGTDKSFSTYAEMIAYIPTESNVTVRNNDPDPTLRGTYIWTGTEYVAGYDPLDAANEFTSVTIAEKTRIERIKQAEKTELLVNELSAFLYDSPSNIVPIYVDEQNNILISYNKSLNRIQVNGIEPKDILDMFSAETNAALYTNEDGIYPLFVDKEENIILAFDSNTGKLVGLFDNDPNLSEEFGINQWVFYGQSLSVGGTNYP